MKRIAIAACLMLISVVGAVPSANADPTTITVRGGWFTDAVATYCNPTATSVGSGTPPSYVSVSCISAQAVDGSFMGHSIATTVMRVFPNGGATGTFDEWIYATSWGDGGIGGLHVSGTFEISSVDGGFSSHGTIVGGTCDFAGSTGTIDSTGYGLTGGYSGQWIRPRPPVAFRPFLHECIAQPSLP